MPCLRNCKVAFRTSGNPYLTPTDPRLPPPSEHSVQVDGRRAARAQRHRQRRRAASALPEGQERLVRERFGGG